MSISIRFDNNNMPIEPTLVLMTRSGKKLGAINVHNINATDNLNSYSELFFSVNKTDAEEIWDSIVDFKLVWVREWNQVYEIYVEYKESQGFIKNVTAKSLGHAELSQINIYNLNANNDTDIENDDVRTVLYNSSDHSHSLLHRIIDEKAPHYTVNHVDTWIRSIQRTFEFNNINILEAFNQIAEELDCIILVDTSIDGTNGLIKREINVYDLEYYCSGSNCNYRGNFVDTCPICGGTNILPGYGNDTTIFVSADNLSDEIDLSVNTDSVKNCFKLEAGDELMTATVMNCNPNGSQYLWYITDETKADMPSNLVDKIEDYDELYEDYQTTHSYDLSSATTNFNTVANTYKTYDASLKTITSPVAGFQNLMESYYDAIDLRIFVSDKCMPEITIPSTTAATQVGLLTNVSLSPVAVQSLDTVSTATATSYVLAIAKTFINSNYELDATATTGVSKTTVDGVVTAATWTGTFTATSYSDETDSATSSAITVSLTDNYSDFLKQRIKKILSSDEDDNDNNLGIIALFNKTLDTDTTPNFYTELHKYSLSSLKIFESCCQGCLDVLISIGAGNTNTWYDDSLNLNDNYDDDVAVVTYTGTSSTGGTVNYYRSFYKPYYKRLLAIQSEIVTREGELAKVDAMMDLIQEKVADTQEALDFRAYLGTTLWNIFSSYRRDDVFSNENFVSDGLDNAELFNMAREFLNDATKEIYKSANLQHSITATLSNLLVMKEFAPIVDYFKVGNWIRVRIEDNIYKLRLISYSVDFDNLSNITVEFSDITRMIDGLSDIESLLNSASSMATSYDYVKRQSKKGLASNEQLRHWVEDGLSLTNLKIVSTAEEQDVAFDEHGILAREYLPLTDEYDDKQLKIINRGLYVTNDKWQTCKAGIGDFLFYDPEEGEVVEGYGVIADTIVGKIILGQEVGIYNAEGSVTINEDGMKICADLTYDDTTDTMFRIQRKVTDNTSELGYKIEDLLYLDTNGDLVVNGTLKVYTGGNSSPSSIVDMTDGIQATDVDAMIDEANALLERSLKSYSDGKLSDAQNVLNGSISDVESRLNQGLANAANDIISDMTEVIDNKLYNLTGEDGTGSISQMIADSAESLMAYTDLRLSNELAPINSYMEMTSSGLKIGAENSAYYTIMGNSEIGFYHNNEKVAYISDQHLYINNATINDRFLVGNYFFNVNADGGMTVVWIDD